MDNTQRFSDRVADYVRYRPHYPKVLLSVVDAGAGKVVADIGSGTGISSELFLGNGNKVYGVEPNAEMRRKSEELLAGYPAFVPIDAAAESTGLPSGSVDLVVSGQAFHWFDAIKAREEFIRILRPGGCVALIWNERLMETPFEKEYEELILRYAGDYKTINHKNITDERIGAFFHPQTFVLHHFDNAQLFNLEGLTGRLLSSSYIPKEGKRHDDMIVALEQLFLKYASSGVVKVRYDTKVYVGTLKP